MKLAMFTPSRKEHEVPSSEEKFSGREGQGRARPLSPQ